MSPDRLSRIVGGAASFLLLEHPYRTSLGVILGTVIGTLLNAFTPYFEGYSSTFRLPATNLLFLGCTALGILIVHLPNFGRLMRKDSTADDNLQKALDVIDEAKKRGLSDREAHKMYLEVVERYLKNIVLNDTTQRQVDKNAEAIRDILGAPDKGTK